MWVYLNTFISVLKEIYVIYTGACYAFEKCGLTEIEAKCGLLMGNDIRMGDE